MSGDIAISIKWEREDLQLDLLDVEPHPLQHRCNMPLALRPWSITVYAPEISLQWRAPSAAHVRYWLKLAGAKWTPGLACHWLAPRKRATAAARWLDTHHGAAALNDVVALEAA